MTATTANTTIGRSKEAGRELVKLTEVPATMRPGSRNADFFTLILKSATSDEAAEKIRKAGMDKPWDVVRLAVMRGMVKLGKKVPVAEGAAKSAPKAKTKAAPKAKPAPKVSKADVAAKKASAAVEKMFAPKSPKPATTRTPRASRAKSDRRGAEAVL